MVNIESIFQALGNKIRLDIVKLIFKKKEISCQEIQRRFPLSQPTMSHHFGLLISSGVITVRKSGVRHFYTVNFQRLKSIGINLEVIDRA